MKNARWIIVLLAGLLVTCVKEVELTLNTGQFSVDYVGGDEQFEISSNASWHISSNQDWCKPVVASGNNNQSIKLVIASNEHTEKREAEITVVAENKKRSKTQKIIIKQNARPYLQISTTSFDFNKEKVTDSFTISSNLSWTIVSDKDWCEVTSAMGKDIQRVGFTVNANETETEREATITVSADTLVRKIKIKQTGVEKPQAELTLSTREIRVGNKEETVSFSITSNVLWSITSNQEWCKSTTSAGINNKNNIILNISANPSIEAREAIVTVKSDTMVRTLSVKQAGLYYMMVSADSLFSGYQDGTIHFDITSNVSWTVASDAEWCKPASTSGDSIRTVALMMTKNESNTPRFALVTVTSDTMVRKIVVKQSFLPLLTVTPDSLSANYTEGNLNFNLTSNTAWTVSTDADWCAVLSSSGNTNRTIGLEVEPNYSGAERVAIITVKADTAIRKVIVKQRFQAILDVSMDNFSDLNAGEHSLQFNISSTLTWNISSDQSWCLPSITNGTGPKNNIGITIYPNKTALPRTATMTVSGNGVTKQITVRQNANNINYMSFDVEGFTFMVNNSFITDYYSIASDLTQTLQKIKTFLPGTIVQQLQMHPIYIEGNSGAVIGKPYTRTGENGFIEINNTTEYLNQTKKYAVQPYLLLNYMAKIYAASHLDESGKILLTNTFNANNSKYASVYRIIYNYDLAYYPDAQEVYLQKQKLSSSKQSSPAFTDKENYFAELTEAYFATNDYYPFDYEELQRYDPNSFALMQTIWGSRIITPNAYNITLPPTTLNSNRNNQSYPIDPFYRKYLNDDGLPIIASRFVKDTTLVQAKRIIDIMLSMHPEYRTAMINKNYKVAIVAMTEDITDIPEWRLEDTYYNTRGRGYGSTYRIPVITCGEENIVKLQYDYYPGESIFVHEFAHNIYDVIANKSKITAAFVNAATSGLWKNAAGGNTYALTNENEYFAEGSQAWFNTCGMWVKNPSGSGDILIKTREQLKNYDRKLHDLLAEIYPEVNLTGYHFDY